MTLWCRIKHSKLKCLSHQFKRCYLQIPEPCLVNYTASHTLVRVLEKPNWVIPKRPTEFCGNARFFAAPVQAKPKREDRDKFGHRLNEQIRADIVRLVTDEGHAVVSRQEALERARKLKLDLVEVQRSCTPPVCKIMDFHKEKYKQQLRGKERTKSKSEMTLRKGDCKEVRFSGKTEQKDLQMKADMVKRLMERGYRVKCMAMGTEDQDLGGLLSRLSALIEDVSFVESGPRVEKRQAYAIVRHIKFGPSKKGPRKTASRVVGATSAEIQKVTTLPPTINPSGPTQSPIQFEEDFNPAEYGSVTEDDILSDEADTPISPSMGMPDKDLEENKTTWSVCDASDDFEKVFDIGDDINGVTESSAVKRMNSAPETASSPENNNISDLLRSRPVLDSTRTNTVPPSQPEPSLGTENRYRSEPRNRFSPAKSMDSKGPGATDSARLEPQFPNQGIQPRSDLNVSPPTGETKQVGTDASPFRNLSLRSNEIPKQESPRPSAPSSPAPSYGIFSSQKTNAPGKQGVAAEVNRNKEGNSFDSAINLSPGGLGANPNLPTSKSDGQRIGVDKGGRGGWGTFSRESSNVIPNRISESQAKVQR